MNLDALPRTLQGKQRFLPWRRARRSNGKAGKVPHSDRNGVLRPCDPLRPANWLHLTSALALVETGAAAGIGLALDPALGITGIDLDDCLSPSGEVSSTARHILDVFGSGAYVERSPGGQGLHALLIGLPPDGWRRRPGVEVITRGFLTVTGDAVQQAPDPWPDSTARLHLWHRQLTQPALSTPALPPTGTSCRPEQLLERARRARSGSTFQALWNADEAAAPSPSEGDLRLLLMLIYWGGSSITDQELDSLFRQSKRYRPKWDSKSGSETYGQRTIQAARRIRG